jgi:serine/threonine protein kinase
MSEPRPPATPPPVPTDATGEWSAATARESRIADNPTLTASGLASGGDSIGIPKQFGRYTIDRLLGRGGMGAVYLAHDTSLERPVALKIPTFRGSISAAQKERFFREARAIAALRHPNICPVHDVDEENGTLYLTMSYIDGRTLAIELRDGQLKQNLAAEIIRRVALGMQVAHEHGTIHRDLKPANIMIDPAGEPVVMDFGLARKGEAEEEAEAAASLPTKTDVALTQMGSVLGTPAYMPPEQAVGDLNAIGPRSDVYSLGAVFYECLTGKRPFDGPDTASVIQKILHVPPPRPREIVKGIDPGLEKVCLKAMAKRPEDRYQSMAEFAQAIKDVIDPQLVVSEPPPIPRRRTGPPKKRRRRWVTPMIFISVSLILVVICAGGPTLAVWLLIGKLKDTFNEFSDSQRRSKIEWDHINARWQGPPEGADANTLFPLVIEGGYRRLRVEQPPADPELGLTLSGQRGVYAGPNGETISVSVYRCEDAQAQSILTKAYTFVQSVSPASPGNGQRQKMVQAGNSSNHMVDYGFTDSNNQNHEYGKLWYSQGWLFHFKADAWLTIGAFPSTYLLEVDKQPDSSKKTPKGKSPASSEKD